MKPAAVSPRRLGMLIGLGALYLCVCLAAFRIAPAWLPDSEIYWTLGRSLAQDGVLTRSGTGGEAELLRTPGYPLVVALGWRIAPGNPYAGLAVLQCLLFAGIAGLTALLGRQVMEDGRGAWAGALVLVYPPLVYYLPAVLMEVTLTAALMLFIVTWLRFTRRPDLATAAWVGLAGAGLALVRPSFALVPVLVFGEGIYRHFKEGESESRRPGLLLVHLGLVAGIHGALLVPWMIRSERLSEGRLPNPLGVGSGIILLLRATQQFSPEGEAAARSDPDFIRANEAAPPREAAESDARCLARARALIRTRPLEYARECVHLALYRLWTESYGGSLPAGAFVPIRIMGAGLLALAAVGAWWLRARPGLLPVALLLGYTGLIHSVGPAVARYTLPCRPLLIVLATGALLALAQARRREHSPGMPAAVAVR